MSAPKEYSGSGATISHPEKVLFPDDGITKGELAGYYEMIAPYMLPHLCGRPVTMERFPSGIGAKGFIQKSVSKGFPEWLQRVEVPKQGGTVHHPIICDVPSLMWMTNQNCVTPHVWTRRVNDIEHPDLCVFDLDPLSEDAEDVRRAALALRDYLDELELPSFVKTSGSKGFHIVIPLDGSTDLSMAWHFAEAVAHAMVARHPEQLTLEFHKVDRGGRILLDTGRNGYSATFAAAYAVRPKAGAPVSAPCTWEEIERDDVHPQSFTLRGMQRRIEAVGDLWADITAHGVSLATALTQLRAPG